MRNAPKVSCYCHSLTHLLIHSLTYLITRLRCVPPLSPVLCLSFSEEDSVERELCAWRLCLPVSFWSQVSGARAVVVCVSEWRSGEGLVWWLKNTQRGLFGVNEFHGVHYTSCFFGHATHSFTDSLVEEWGSVLAVVARRSGQCGGRYVCKLSSIGKMDWTLLAILHWLPWNDVCVWWAIGVHVD